jgi:NAD(P)H dehydrogenase (quinone)
MSIVVTGATGHLGRLIVEDLLANGVPPADVVAAGRRVEALDDLAGRGVRVAHIDYSDAPTLATALTGADTLMLVSGTEFGRRVPQHQAAIDAAVAAGARRVVYTSAPHADTSALVVAPEHKATEELIRASGLAFTILRNNWYTEGYVPTVEQARGTGVIVTSTGDGRVASATRADLAAAASAVLRSTEHDGAAYELGGDHAWDYDELAGVIGGIVGRPVVRRDVSSEEHVAFLRTVGLDEQTAELVVTIDANIRAGLLAGGSTDLSTLIGRPTTTLAEGLRAALGEH